MVADEVDDLSWLYGAVTDTLDSRWTRIMVSVGGLSYWAELQAALRVHALVEGPL